MTELPDPNQYLSQWAVFGYSQSNQDKQKPGWHQPWSEPKGPQLPQALGTPAIELTFKEKDLNFISCAVACWRKFQWLLPSLSMGVCILSFMLTSSVILLANTKENRCYWFLLATSCCDTEAISVHRCCFSTESGLSHRQTAYLILFLKKNLQTPFLKKKKVPQ